MLSRNARLTIQLGMNPSTAWMRLRKATLFKYVVKANDNICFRCGNTIDSADELSFEHKEPWENRDANLFWDLDNLAFSHKACNRPHLSNNGAVQQRLVGSEGMVWCNRCKNFLPTEQFHRNAARWNGYQKSCKECHKVHKGRVKA